MATDIIDLFGQAPFQQITLTNVVNEIIPRPTLLSALGVDLFNPVPSSSGQIAAYRVGRDARLIGTSALGAPPERLEQKGGKMRRFGTRRMAKATTLHAVQLQNILQQPLYQAVTTAQEEIARRAALIRDDFELTFEYHRLGAVLGYQLDADGVTVLEDWYDEWGLERPGPTYLNLLKQDLDPRIAFRKVENKAKDASNGAWIEGQTVLHALCGEEFYSALTNHTMVRQTYLNYSSAAELRGRIPNSFYYGGIVFHEYRSALDPRFGIASDECRTFPVGAREMFQWVKGPAEFDPYINQPGRDLITITFGDLQRRAWWELEMYSYPLFMCMRPEMLGRHKMQAS